MLTLKNPSLSSNNLRLLRRIAKAADKNKQITMGQMVNLFNSQGRNLKSPPCTYISVVLKESGYLRHVAYGLYEVTNKTKRAVCL